MVYTGGKPDKENLKISYFTGHLITITKWEIVEADKMFEWLLTF